jgi:hypothetical protein
MSTYIKSQFSYNYTSTVVEIKIPSLTREILEDEAQYALIVKDITQELRKFGTLRVFNVNGDEDSREIFLPM